MKTVMEDQECLDLPQYMEAVNKTRNLIRKHSTETNDRDTR